MNEYKGIKISQSEAALIKILESEINSELYHIEEGFYHCGAFNSCFTTRNNQVIGINLYNQNLKEFAETLIKFKHLMDINLMNNLIESIPDSISKTPSIRMINLGRNQIKTFPEEITRIKTLLGLYLHINSIEDLPPSFETLKHLITLRLDYNDISYLPDIFCKFVNLEELYIDGNKIYTLPDSLFDLPKLRILGLSPKYLNLELQVKVDDLKKKYSEYVRNSIPEEKIPAIGTYLYHIPILNIITPPYKIRFFYEYGGEMFWPESDSAYIKFGTPINPYNLPFSREVAKKFKELVKIWESMTTYGRSKGLHIGARDRESLILDTANYLERATKELGEEFEFCEDYEYYIEKKRAFREKRIT
jgi:hypothetical protein